jgi:hypothetical protein
MAGFVVTGRRSPLLAEVDRLQAQTERHNKRWAKAAEKVAAAPPPAPAKKKPAAKKAAKKKGTPK